MRKNPKANSRRIGIDARLAYRRGVGTYAANLIASLAKIDKRNHYVIFNAPSSLKKQVSNKRFRWVEVPFSNAAHYEQVLLPRAAEEQGVDFIHYVDNSASVVSGVPFLLTLHDTMHIRPLSKIRPNPTLRQRLVFAYKKWAIPRSALLAQAIVTVSEYSKSRIVAEMRVNPKKVWVTPEGVDRRLYKKVSRKPSKLFKILVHGAADDRKNLSNILKAAKRLVSQGKKFQMIVIGMDKAEMECTNYLQEVIEMNIGNYVEWVGNVPFEMLNPIYAEVDLFLYPSRMEGFGLPVLEAFASGVPVITSTTTSLPEVAGDAALLVDPEKPEAIAQAVKRVMEKPALGRQLVRRGLARAKLFGWDKTARLTLEVYERMGTL